MAETTTEATTWLDHMPALPLGRNVPVIDLSDGSAIFRGERLICLGEPNDTHGNTGGHSMLRGDVWPLHKLNLRIDLGDPQGFGYALCWYFQARTSAQRNSLPDWSAITNRHLHGKTTDDDRYALAVSCEAAA